MCALAQTLGTLCYAHTFALTTLTPARPPKPTPMPPPHEELRWAKRGVSPTTNNKVSANIHSTHYMHLFYARRRCAHLVWMPLSCPSLSFAVHRREVTYNGARIGAHVDSRGEMTKCEVAVRLSPHRVVLERCTVARPPCRKGSGPGGIDSKNPQKNPQKTHNAVEFL